MRTGGDCWRRREGVRRREVVEGQGAGRGVEEAGRTEEGCITHLEAMLFEPVVVDVGTGEDEAVGKVCRVEVQVVAGWDVSVTETEDD